MNDLVLTKNNCDSCMHSAVCQYKIQFSEILAQIEGKVDNVCMPEIFKVSMDCSQYVTQMNMFTDHYNSGVQLLRNSTGVMYDNSVITT